MVHEIKKTDNKIHDRQLEFEVRYKLRRQGNKLHKFILKVNIGKDLHSDIENIKAEIRKFANTLNIDEDDILLKDFRALDYSFRKKFVNSQI